VKKYHIVRSSDPKKVAKYIYPCPERLRPVGEGAVRHSKSTNDFISNFKGSENFLDRSKFTINWTKSVDGTTVGMFKGLVI